MKRKIIAACLIACMVLVAVTSATLAYFTDKDALKNEFTIGDIAIDLWEIVDYTPQEDSDGQPIDPAPVYVGKGTDKAEASKYEYTNLLPSDEITKEVHIENTSDVNAAYVRVTVVINNIDKINVAIDEYYEPKGKDAEFIQNVYDDVFPGWGINYSKRAEYPGGSRMWMTTRQGLLCNIDTIANHGNYYRIDCANKFMTDAEREAENGDGIFQYGWGDPMDDLYYQDAVPDANTRAYVFYVALDAGEEYTIFDGLKVPAYFEEQAAMFDGLKIDVYADAIQATGFNGDWEAAFDALNEALPIGHWNVIKLF